MGEIKRRRGIIEALKKGGTVRISGGRFRGQKIRTPGRGTHPMGERERIALFNMIADRIGNNFVMDLYCGGGTLGIEALSRGAIYALCIDKNPDAVRVANDNMRKLGLYGPHGGALEADITIVARTATDRYGIVIADPPYDEFNDKMTKYLPRLVLDNGTLVLSHPGKAPELKGLTLEKSHSYAGATISVYRKFV